MARTDPVDDRLGRLLSTHPVAAEEYQRTGVIALGVAVLGGLGIALLIAVPFLTTGKLAAFVLIPAFAGLPIAAVQLARALRSGGDEAFELYENGFARRGSAGRQGWTWPEVAVLRTNPDQAERPPTAPIDKLTWRLGWNLRCSIRLTDGCKVRIDGYTAEGPAIARALLAHCPRTAPRKSRRRWIMLGGSPLAGVAFGVPIIMLYRHMNSTRSDEISGGMLVAEVLAMIACLVGLALSFGVFIAALQLFARKEE